MPTLVETALTIWPAARLLRVIAVARNPAGGGHWLFTLECGHEVSEPYPPYPAPVPQEHRELSPCWECERGYAVEAPLRAITAAPVGSFVALECGHIALKPWPAAVAVGDELACGDCRINLPPHDPERDGPYFGHPRADCCGKLLALCRCTFPRSVLLR